MRHTKNKHKKSKKLWQRGLCIITVIALVVNTMYSGGLFRLFNFSTVKTVRAEATYTPTNDVSVFSGTEHIFPDSPEGYVKFVDYCYYYSINKDDTFCDTHKGDKLTINIPVLPNDVGFMGLGNADVPFAGKVTFVSDAGRSNITLPRALFTHVSTDARITDNSNNNITLEISKNSSVSSPIFADHVHPGTNASDWSIEVSSGNTNSFAGAIGQIETDASVVLDFKNASSATVSNTASGNGVIKDVGEICGIMKTGSSLTVTDNSSARTAVSSTNGNAGSLVGSMEGTASLTLSAYPSFSSISVTSTKGYAGGLVGKSSTSATITGLASLLTVGGTVSGKEGAGGLYGYYKNTASTFDLKNFNITATVSADYCGGVFGVLDNNKGTSETAVELTIKNTGNAGTVNVSSGSSATSGYFGGIAGKYTTDALVNSLVLDGISVTVDSNAAFDSFGGAIGIVDSDSAAYIKADGLNITATGTAKKNSSSYFGGLIGKTSDEHEVFIDLGDFTLSADSAGFKGGGVAGNFKNGVLRLSGTTNLSSAKSQKGGQLVGVNDNVLVYALGTGSNGTSYGSGWTFKRSSGSQVDDLGTWGEVVRSIDDSATTNIKFDSAAHTAKIAAVTANATDNDYKISSASDFKNVALNIQLNTSSAKKECLLFTTGSANSSTLLSGKLTITANINLSGTGITGFMRDGGTSVGNFSGTLDATNSSAASEPKVFTISLAAGEPYGYVGNTLVSNIVSYASDGTPSGLAEGMGQIYRHQYNGLFASAGGASCTIKNVKIGGHIIISNKVDDMNIGGVAAVNGGDLTITKVIADEYIYYNEPSVVTDSENKNIGGYIGEVKTNGTVTIKGLSAISATFDLNGDHSRFNVYGGAIGRISAASFTLNVGAAGDATNKLTNKLTVKASGLTAVGDDSNGGGLVGYITNTGSYSNRKVNINNLIYDDCTIANASNSKGGGLLGYRWLCTTTTVNDMTVTSATINNVTTSGTAGGNTDVGAMCYSATGKWDVKKLTVTSLGVSGGASGSVGMLVNKAYDGTNGLYLNVLNSGYTLSNVTLPSSGIIDEIAAYSADDVIAGGAGVINIDMNVSSGTKVKITETGTYQNQLSLGDKKANSHARYYYNLNHMSKTANSGQNLVLWSVKKYAATNIAGEFDSGFTTELSGNADLTGLSFYPVATADNYTLNGLNVTFDYDSIYTTAEETFPTGLTTDNYKRDPGATGANKNQHYLMHGGLFINLPAGKTITVTGSSSLSGNFLEVDSYKAALISRTMNGNLNISGTLDLNGLIPKTTGNTLYSNGYLLINSISRPDSQTQTVSVNISGLTASGYSSATLPVAKSLIGTAEGRGFMFDFSGIKLDGRKAALDDSDTNSALNTAYGTSRSIFSNAILFYSINTDRNAEMTYNFTYDDDWGTGTGSTAKRDVAYGNEISHTIEYWDNENNKSRQSKYSGIPKNYTNPKGENTEYNFQTTKFLPYVYVDYNPNADHSVMYYREIKVNYLLEITSEGCGTYNDPYIIKSPDQLSAIAAFIKSGNTSTIYLNSITLPKYDSTKHHGVALNATGNRWCTDKGGDDYHAEYDAKNGGGFYATGCTDWPDADARYYLANAYYKIESNITLGSDFVGLGGTEANYAFRGVIVGDTNAQNVPKYTITNKSQNPLIHVSNGCVVKDVNIVVNYSSGIQLEQKNNSSTKAYFGYDYSSADTCNFYGGIIGEIMGGDNIIDNSYVTYSNTSITLKGNFATIVPVGGYVGVVVYGGLIFKNMAAAKTTIDQTGLSVKKIGEDYNLADNSDDEAWAAIYVNPIVGRVINGYAVNETGGTAKKADGTSVKQYSTSEDGHYHDDDNSTRSGAVNHTLQNGKKHYSIADLNPDLAKLDVTKVASGNEDGNIDVPNAQALFVLSLITQSGAGTATGNGSAYNNSFSYGTYNNHVNGMSHNASYSDVGTDETTSDDYSTYVGNDTAANTAVPYIIRHYTKIEQKTIDIGWTISFDVNGTTKYLTLNNNSLRAETTPYYFESITKESNGKWKIQGQTAAGTTKYLQCRWSNGFAENANYDQGSYIDLYNSDGSLYTNDSINGNSFFLSNMRTSGTGADTRYYFQGNNKDKDSRHLTAVQNTSSARLVRFNHVTETNTAVFARCVTSTLGYYNINLTGSGTYQLPDSFRGLGCVGIYDTVTGVTNPYSIKLNTFNGNGCTIDQDIYLNKYYTDNYFNELHTGAGQSPNSDRAAYNHDSKTNNHGIGLFDSVILKSGGKFYNFTLKGSVKTAMFSNTYSAAEKEFKGVPENGTLLWLSTGGVLGWSRGDQALNFNNISLDNLMVNGANYVGGLLAHSGNDTANLDVTITECTANAITLSMSAAQKNDGQPRNAMGTFVGKVKQGKVVVLGNTSTRSSVTIKSYSFGNDTQYFYNSVGGLVGYSGHGFEAYDMNVSSSESSGTTIGNSNTGICGGIIGVMQPYSDGNEDATAIFKNCSVTNLNVQGNMAGGIYGGKWTGSTWVPYRIEMENCNVIGVSPNNSITGGGYAGGLVGNGLVYTRKSTSKEDANIIIKDCKVSNYTITSNTNGYSGGFVGYCDSVKESITCYIHDSSVENCIIGQTGSVDYAGGAVGGIALTTTTGNITTNHTDNKIVGYNIKLDNVTSPSNQMGGWVGYMDQNDSSTSIQFTGVGIYGNGFAKNVGNRDDFSNASFVFADYGGACASYDTTNNPVSGLNCSDHSSTSTTHVEMPKYPYVNINPQSSMGTGEIISSDGAVLSSTASSTAAYSSKTAETTMALKIYEDTYNSDTGATNYSRRYTTFKTYNDTDAAKINGEYKIDHYMQQDVGNDGDRISNYYDEKGYTTAQAYDNFACIVIANNNAQETTDLINRYAQLVTNTSTDYAGTDASNTYFDIVVSPCVLSDGKFAIDTSAGAAPGLTYSGGQFRLNGSSADSLKPVDSFTLVDIQFKDPLDTNKVAYHLYIPVYTIKEIEIFFSTAVMNGTNSVSYNSGSESVNPYLQKLAKTTTDAHVDNLNTWYTTYIRYTYSHDDIQALLDSGNLNWNHDKYFYIDKYANNAVSMLPVDTYMILIDPNGNHDKKYQASLNSTDFAVVNNRITFDLEKFVDSSNEAFHVSTFNELIAQNITAAPNGSNTGRYNLYSGEGTPLNTAETHYVYIKTADGTPEYYQYVGSGGGYDITLSAGDVYENYYISMFVPGDENDSNLYGYYIRTPESFVAPTYESGTNNAVTKSAKVNCVYAGTNESGENTINRQVYIGNVFDQDTVLNVLPNDLEIDGSNHILNIFATTTITPKNNDVFAILSGINPDIYHSFNIFLDKKNENGVVTNEISGLDPENDPTDIQAWYSIDNAIPISDNADMSGFTSIDADNIDFEGSYINVVTVDGGQSILQSGGVTIYSRIKLDFGNYESEFPQKVASDTGVSVRAASNLAYDSLSLAFSNMSEPIEEPVSSKHIFYRQSLSTAKLKYYAETEPDSFDTDGLPSENYSRLGVSGLYSMNQYMPVNTIAQYNVQNIESSIENADTLYLTLSLQKKTDAPNGGPPYTSASYRNVSSINRYWGAVVRDGNNEVAPNSSGAPVTDTGTNLRIQCGSYDQVVTVAANTKTFTLSIPKEDLAHGTSGFTVDENGYIYVNIGFNAKTGSGFTEYANYKVNLSVKLMDGVEDITGSYADDYLIYTNAKVNHDFLKHDNN